MENKKKLIAFSALMLMLGFVLGLSFAGLTWLNFVNSFAEFPYNQGLFTGAVIFEQEIYNQCPDFNAEKISPEYYAVIVSNFKEHGSDSISCWLIDTGSMFTTDKTQYDCEPYEQELENARKLLKGA